MKDHLILWSFVNISIVFLSSPPKIFWLFIDRYRFCINASLLLRLKLADCLSLLDVAVYYDEMSPWVYNWRLAKDFSNSLITIGIICG